MKDYEITYWANGFGRWFAKADFVVPLGNTGEAMKVLFSAEKKAKQIIRREIADRMFDRPKRLSYEVTANEEMGCGHLLSVTWAER